MPISSFPPVSAGRTTIPTLQQTVTSTQVVTLPAGVDQIFYIAMGGGGGGGGVLGGQSTQSSSGGGGSGFLDYGILSGLSQSTRLPIVIGAGGTGGPNGSGQGGNGGNTIIGNQVVVNGGFGAIAQTTVRLASGGGPGHSGGGASVAWFSGPGLAGNGNQGGINGNDGASQNSGIAYNSTDGSQGAVGKGQGTTFCLTFKGSAGGTGGAFQTTSGGANPDAAGIVGDIGTGGTGGGWGPSPSWPSNNGGNATGLAAGGGGGAKALGSAGSTGLGGNGSPGVVYLYF